MQGRFGSCTNHSAVGGLAEVGVTRILHGGTHVRDTMIGTLIGLGAAAAAFTGGFGWTRNFVRTRLRFVDAVHSRPAPFVAGAVAAIVAAPVVWVLPIVGAGTALALGIGTGLGVRSAQKDRHLLGP